MKRWIPLLVLALGAAYLASTLAPVRNPGEADLAGFGRLPVLDGGRIKPFDTVARSSLLMLGGRQRVVTPDRREITPDEWLLDVLFRPERANACAVFVIDNPDVLSLIGRDDESLAIHYSKPSEQTLATLGFLPSRQRRFSFNELTAHIPEIDRQAQLAQGVDAPVRSPFQNAIIQLDENLRHYTQIGSAFVPPGEDDFLGDVLRLHDSLPAGIAAVRAKEAGRPYDEKAAGALLALGEEFQGMDGRTTLLPIPPDPGSASPDAWMSTGKALLNGFGDGSVNPVVMAYAGMSYAWRHGDAGAFNHLVVVLGSGFGDKYAAAARKCRVEFLFNAADPFSASMTLYVIAFLAAVLSWLKWPETASRSALLLVALAWAAASVGIATRMWMEGRPPVTNLYSSALFIGWGAVLLCLVLEVSFRNGIGSAAAGLIGFATLIIAHHLALAGDTLEMMRAVLDSNFWLGTHVVVVTLGYASTFLAGLLALIHVVRGVFTRSLDAATARSLERMVYGIVCFATLFSFVGTVLGGIWADQSWGRFWGWDPKENGALIIVLWNAVILHARWGGLVRQRGLMALAIFGNIVTTWSWFGTNMLGVGLHSYGFTQAAFVWLISFVAFQLVMIGIALLPPQHWRSLQKGPSA